MSYSLKIVLAFSIILIIVLFFLYETDISLEEAKETLLKTNSEFIEIDGLDVHYVREGKGFPIILIHGTGALLHTWDGWNDFLKKDYEVIRMDLPAFGLTGPRKDNDYSIEMYIDFINKFVKALEVDSFHLAGNSLGGEIVWNYTIKYPDKIGKIILLNPAGIEQKDKKSHLLVFRLAKNNFLVRFIKNLGTKYFVKQAVNTVYFDNSKIKKDIIHLYHQSALRAGNRAAVLQRLNQIKYKPEQELWQIKAPTLVIWGKHDKVIDVAVAEKYERNIPNVKIIVYDNAGHVPMEEIPQKTVDVTMNFLRE